MSELSKLAKVRNWSKYRLLGVTFPKQGLTIQEIAEIHEIQGKILAILSRWDERSMQLNLVPRKNGNQKTEN
jgi:hypothetical protein